MKNTMFFRRLLILTGSSIFLLNCNSSTILNAGLDRKVAEWYNSHEWLKGLQLIPHESINQLEFFKQYHKNKIWWDKAFDFLKTHNLYQLEPGKYVIDSGNVIATVSEVAPKDRDSVKWEAHRNFNDLQYVIMGKAKMGIASISSPNAKVIIPYSSEDNENFSVNGGKYYNAEPGTFFIFSPHEIHRPVIKVAGYDMIKKIVVKVRVP